MLGGRLEFADLGMQPVFGTRIHSLSGSVLGLSSRPGRRGTVALQGEVDQVGDVRIRGALAPFAPTDDLDLALTFRNIPIRSLNPYSATFAGWTIDDGRLSVDLRYLLEQRRLKGDNRVVIDSIKLGHEVEDYQGSRLPLRLAVALLEDSDGRIDLSLPVQGSLDDPQFSYGHLVWQAIRTVLVKVVSAPFRALSALLGKEGFDEVYATPGEAALSAPEREKLGKLGELLQKRPQLRVALSGRWDPDADARELARARADGAILQAAGFTLHQGEPLPLPNLDDSEIRAALRSIYASQVGRVRLLQRLVTTPDGKARWNTLRDELIAAQRIGADELSRLADARAQAARAVVLAGRPELAERVTLAPSASGKGQADGVPLGVELQAK